MGPTGAPDAARLRRGGVEVAVAGGVRSTVAAGRSADGRALPVLRALPAQRRALRTP